MLSMEVLTRILVASWVMLGEMSPYLLLGFLVAGILSVIVSPTWVERHLGRGGARQVLTASLFGVPLPLCSCGVLPVGASLRRHGAGKGATTSFMLSTPQTGVDSIAVTWALLGPVVAVIRPLAAFVTGIAGGAIVHVVDRDEPLAGGADDDTHAKTPPSTAGHDREPVALRALRYGFLVLPRDIGRALVVGILLSGVIAAFLGPQTLDGVLGGGVLPYLAAIAVGVPLYVCATASTPIAASLIGAGLSPGAALVFLISGPATNGAALTTLLRVLGRRSTAIYLATVVVGAITTGLVVDTVFDRATLALPAIAVDGHAHGHHQEAGGFGVREASSLALIAVLAAALWPHRGRGTKEESDVQDHRIVLAIDGMRCNGCAESVTRAITECGGVEAVSIELEAGRAVIDGNDLDVAAICGEVAALGFECAPAGHAAE
jgi:uncharacterized membrane protein YraQ (UPF0718 family)/copper chaperone CopZ